jgi:N-acetylmuramoyl-L-alanine amidase
MIVSTAMFCLALNIYHEARGEPIMGQYAVAHVTMNRAGQDEDKVCQEVFKPYQFSWANNAVQKVRGGWQIASYLKPREAHAWWVANRIAVTVLSGRMPDITKGATHYHTLAVKPYWRKAFQAVMDIGRHRFYAALPSKSELTASL